MMGYGEQKASSGNVETWGWLGTGKYSSAPGYMSATFVDGKLVSKALFLFLGKIGTTLPAEENLLKVFNRLEFLKLCCYLESSIEHCRNYQSLHSVKRKLKNVDGWHEEVRQLLGKLTESVPESV